MRNAGVTISIICNGTLFLSTVLDEFITTPVTEYGNLIDMRCKSLKF